MEKVLLYNLSGTEKGRKIKAVLALMGIRVKEVHDTEYKNTIGSLAGIKGYEKENAIQAAQDTVIEDTIPEEMLVMCGFSSQRVDEMLRNFRKKEIERVNLKAVVTPTNATWNSLQLYEELKREHEAMTKGTQK